MDFRILVCDITLVVVENSQRLMTKIGDRDLGLHPSGIFCAGVGYRPASFDIPSRIQLILVMLYPQCTGLIFRETASDFLDTCCDQ